MITIEATIPCATPPAWAVLERALLAALDEAVYPFLAKYTREDGSLIWRDATPETYGTRDGADDFYESFFNWPLLYLLGGGGHLLALAERQWDAVTRQLTAYGLLHKEYERGYDQFHQSEGYISFYLLCLADPTNPRLVERARRFAGFYLGEDTAAPNYDPEHRIIRAPHNGSGGPRWGYQDGDPSYAWTPDMAPYGLPYFDVPGVATYEDLRDAVLARRMGEVLQARMGRGDVAVNLCVTSLVTNAFLLTGDDAYRRWVLDYVDGWVARARRNGGLLPDNVGLSGAVGEYIDGKWYGGLYGWTWPHGFYNIGAAATVAAANAFLLSGDAGYLDLPRTQMDVILARGEVRDARTLEMSLAHHWIGQLPAADEPQEFFVVPYRHGDQGWFDYQPMSPILPTALWNLTMDASDWARIEALRRRSPYHWRRVLAFRTKEESGHEQPWLRFLAGENPDYPEAILAATYGELCRRLAQIREDDADLTTINIHHWQELNPILTEALVQLTLGAPQVVYYGGLLHARIRYFDPERRRPGLPPDVAALVERLEADRTVLRLVNLNPSQARTVLIQAGALGEHHFVAARYPVRTNRYPGPIGSYAASALETRVEIQAIDDRYLHVQMGPASELTLDLEMRRFVHQPSYREPWGA
jgi:hypothetical protein